MRFTQAMRHGRLAATVVGLSLLGGCGEAGRVHSPSGGSVDIGTWGPLCNPRGAYFDEEGTYSSPLPLTLGRPQTVTARLEVTPMDCPSRGTFVRLEWYANFSTDRVLRARLVGCEACTVVYDEQEAPYGQRG